MCMTICAVNLWNCLEQEVKISTNIILFRNRYKNIFIEQYQNECR